MARVVQEHGFVATGGGGNNPVTNGYGTNSNSLVWGVNVAGTQAGVVCNGPTGVQGNGQDIGVQGQATAANGNGVLGSATDPTGIGVQGSGTGVPGIGVQGVSGQGGAGPSGTGVQGQSVAGGVGVIGQSVNVNPPTAPYVGVYGTSQTQPTEVYPINDDYLATGVLGIGDRYGGVFQATPVAPGPGGDEQYANIQLSPVELGPTDTEVDVGDYVANNQIHLLASQGQPGDITAVPATDSDGRPSVELWLCIRPAETLGQRQVGATWARISLDMTATMASPG
jgi:hypothetical protein